MVVPWHSVFDTFISSGLDDSRNTALLAWKMIRDGCLMKITRSLNKVSGVLLLSSVILRPRVVIYAPMTFFLFLSYIMSMEEIINTVPKAMDLSVES